MTNLSNLFISTAWAQDAQAQGGVDASVFMNFMPLILIFAVFYVLIIKPQQRKMEEQAKMVKSLQVGDSVLTNSGLYGKVVRLEGDADVVLEIANGVQVKMLKAFVTNRLGVANVATVGK